MQPLKFTRFTQSVVWVYSIAFVMGLLIGFKVIPPAIVGASYMALCVLCVYLAITYNVFAFFTLVPFLIYTEIFVRAYALFIPYLTLQYLFIICFILLLITGPKNRKAHFSGYVFFVLFGLLELLNNVHPEKAQIARSILINTFALFMAIVWAAFNVMSPVLIKKLLYNIKIAGVFLAGIVFVAHLQGKIDYNSASSSDASNGMAPVQLSGYLGTACILFFLSIMNKEEARARLFNLAFLGITAMVMILTFSRGGLYFLGAIIVLFVYYNRANVGQYAKFILLIPVGLVIYSMVVEETGGKIVERYEQKGSSSRDILVEIGFELFLRNPVTGVGTSNYNTMILKEQLFYQETGAHNEFVRAAAEHGIVGIILHWGFFIVLFFNITGRGQPQRQYAMYFFVLFCLITVHNGLKISLQPIVMILAISIQSIPYRSTHVHHPTLLQAEPA